MSRILSCSYNYSPSTSSSVKPHSSLVLSVPYFNKPIQLVGYAHKEQRLAMVARYRGGRGFDIDEGIFSDEDEEELAEIQSDPNLDLERIDSPTVRLLDEQNNMIGVLPTREALKRGEQTGLMLAIVSAEADPPVLRIFQEEDYRKHLFEKEKKKKVQQKKQVTRTKEVKLGLKIDEHDYAVRQKHATKFLRGGHKVKVIVPLRNKQLQYKDTAIDLLRRFQDDLGPLASEESKNFAEKNVYIVLMPNKANIQREQQQKEREEELQRKQEEVNTEEQLKKQEVESGASIEEISANV
ncbi:Translation initiation factor IF-3 [Rhynchospora pubera]|uniref:Translation initiation factor IF-3 n=1 Tax=Rhynchospora pubera TaxID=906938 RepID=A0AAV8CF48_9POAL|nr:Translation initiation factor IF-3 [Rhynchospora pubera]